jgi:hypothetical protein
MLEVVSDDLWMRIEALAKKAPYRYGAIAYVTNDTHITFGDGDVLVVDASDDAVSSGQTSAKVLQAAYTRGAELYSVDGLHSKVLALGRVAVVGSGNMSSSSANQLVEAAIITDSPSAVAGVLAFIDELKKQSDTIDEKFLARIGTIPVKKIARRGTKKKISIPKHRTWLIGVVSLEEDQYPEEDELAEEGLEKAQEQAQEQGSIVSWIRFTDKSLFKREAKPGDSVIRLWRSSLTSTRVGVHFPSPILRRQDETPGRTRFYVENFENDDEFVLSWTRFKALWAKVTDDDLPKKNSIRGINESIVERLIALWDSV